MVIETELFRRVRIEAARIKRCSASEKRDRGARILRGLISALQREAQAPSPRRDSRRAACAGVHPAFTAHGNGAPDHGSSQATPLTGNSNLEISGVGGV